MMADIDEAIRRRVYDLVLGALSLESFEEWFVGETWDDRTPLIVQIDHVLAEKPVLSDDELLEELKELIVTIEYRDFMPAFETGSTARTVTLDRLRSGGNETIRHRLEFAGTPPAGVRA